MTPQTISGLNDAAEHWWQYVFHATWQASAVVLIAFALIAVVRRLPATWQYGLLIIALLKFAAPPFLTAKVGAFHWVGVTGMVLAVQKPTSSTPQVVAQSEGNQAKR